MSDSWLKRLHGGPGAISEDLPAGSADAVQVAETLGAGVVWWAEGVGAAMAERITATLPDLGSNRAHLRVLQRGTTSTALRATLLLASAVDELVTAEALDAARDFARRGMSLGSILRGIRIGHACMTEAFLDALEHTDVPLDRVAEMRRTSKVLLDQIDAFSTAMEAEFRQESESGVAASAASRIQMVNRLLTGDADPAQASSSLGYPLEQRHVGLVAWSRGDLGAQAGAMVRQAATTLLDTAGCVRHLFVPVGAGVLWAWGSLPDPERLAATTQASIPPLVEVAVGEIGAGLSGFRATHTEARAVERLLRLAPRPRDVPVTLHQHIALAILLATDTERARIFLRRTLGALGADDPRTRETRETLRCYLDEGRSLATVADKLQIARNTVTYRVRRAEKLSGRSVDEHHMALHCALLLADYVAV